MLASRVSRWPLNHYSYCVYPGFLTSPIPLAFTKCPPYSFPLSAATAVAPPPPLRSGGPLRFSASRSSSMRQASMFGQSQPPLALSESSSDSGLTTSEETPLENNGYQVPPKEISQIVDAQPTPFLSFSPKRDEIVLLKRRALPPLSELARPEVKLAGLRIDADCNTRSRMSFYTGISIYKLLEDGSLGQEREVWGLPDGAKINFLSWSRDGSHLSFSIRGLQQENGSMNTLGLWVADVASGKARQLIGPPEFNLNTLFDSYSWVDESTLVVCTIPSRGERPKKPIIPSSPKIQSNEQQDIIQARTYQDLLKDKHDEDLFDYYATSKLLLVSLDGRVESLGQPAIYTSVEPSPDGKYLLVSSIHRPYSFIVPCGRFPKKVEVWTRNGDVVREICSLPLAEDIPIAFNSVRKGRRSVSWRADKPSSLYWVETQDGGDARVEVSPRDIIYSLSVELPEGEEPTVFHKLDLRFGGIIWGDSFALVYESWYKTRCTRTWIVPQGYHDRAHVLFERSSEDVYSDPGTPMLRRTSFGTYVLAQIRNAIGKKYLLLNGNGATPQGDVPFLDLLDIDTGKKERIWQSDRNNYYERVVALMSDQLDSELEFQQLKVLLSRESQSECPQFFMLCWPDCGVTQITNFPHPYPQLADLRKELLRYSRNDGVQLTAMLYTPPGYESSRDGPLPMLFWSYPGEFKSKDTAGQVRGSPNEFAGIGSTSALLWLARGFAILDGPTIPIIGEGDEEANDRYVEQLVASAEAAVNEVVRLGIAHPNKIAVGGHSYGAFMAANLLAHAPHLFCCGIARSGAYNRTLTPFGFQNEERTLWEALQTYISMSPFVLADKIKKPLLLIHGEEDNNPGTLTMQSERFFSALKGHGAPCRLVLLPLESHHFSARETIMHVLWEMDRWLQKYCISIAVDGLLAKEMEANGVDSNGQDRGTLFRAGKVSSLGMASKEQKESGHGKSWRPLSSL